MKTKPTYAVVIPAYNEERTITKVIAGIRDCCAAGQAVTEIIVVDDGSCDQTARLARRAGATLIKHPFNMGYGVALQTGYKYCARRLYDAIIQMDADDQHDPCHIPTFLAQITSNQADVLIGSRFLGSNHYRVGPAKRSAIALFRGIIKWVSGATITDPTSGYQCLSAKVLPFFIHDSFPYDYPDANVIVMLLKSGFNIKEIPTAMRVNPQGKSMHRGLLTLTGYFANVFLAIFIALIRSRTFYTSGEPCP